MNKLQLGFDLEGFNRHGIKLPVNVEVGKKIAHLLIVGKSGSGKSTAVLYYLYQMMVSKENHIVIADYKGGEEYFDYFNGSEAYSSAEEAVNMIQAYYDFFTIVRREHIKLKKHYTLVIEEYRGLLAYLESKDKNKKKEVMTMVGELLAVARGLNIGVMLVVQRADATFFTAGARENFQCIISCGRTSKEQFSMLGFSEEMEDNPSATYDAGKAIVLIDGKMPQEVIVPWIRNFTEMAKETRRLLDCQPSLQELVRAIDEGKRDGL